MTKRAKAHIKGALSRETETPPWRRQGSRLIPEASPTLARDGLLLGLRGGRNLPEQTETTRLHAAQCHQVAVRQISPAMAMARVRPARLCSTRGGRFGL